MGWWVAELLASNPALLIAWVVWVIGSIVLHELAHGWAAIWQGDRTPIETGHMTWNPLVHMGGLSLLVFAAVGIAWGMMPVNPSRFRSRHGDVLVALAGPAMNLALALLCCVLAAIWIRSTGGAASPSGSPLATNLQTFFVAGAWLNLVLCGFNLLPLPPLDGSRVLAGLVPAYRRLLEGPNAGMLAVGGLILLFWFIGPRIWGPAADLAWVIIDVILRALP